MDAHSHESPGALQARMRLAFEMHAFGVAAYKCALRRREPGLDEAALSRRVGEWLGHGGYQAEDHPGFRAREWKA